MSSTSSRTGAAKGAARPRCRLSHAVPGRGRPGRGPSIADLKVRVDLAEIVARRTELTRRGHELWGRCPLQGGDRTPGFAVTVARQAFKCFGCDARGDVLGFPDRPRAWSAHHGHPVQDTFVWVPVRLRFLGEETTVAAAAENVLRLRALVEGLEGQTGLPCVLIVVDTAARAMTGGDEDSARGMGDFPAPCAAQHELPGRPALSPGANA
jgi:hypothetical protein